MTGTNRNIAAFLVLLCTTAVLSAPQLTTESLVITSSEAPKEPSDEKETSPETITEPSTPGVPKIYQMDVTTNVTNRFATTQVLSKVKNLGQKAQEATFSIVLPETAYISKFVMEIDGKSYEAYVKEKEEAKQIYDHAVQSGISAGHVEASARNSNRFTVSVNVEPQSKATFKLWYEELLQKQNEQYEVVLNIHPGQPVKNLDVKVNINETRPLKFVKSPSLRSGNEISKNNDNLDPLADIQIKDNQATVTFNPDLERQKVLAKGLGGKEENGLSGQFVVQYDVEHDPQGGEVLVKDGYFVHFFSPAGLPPLPKHVVFVLDTSGSMDGNRIQQLKQAMNSILAELKEDDILNLVEFSSTVRVWDIPSVAVKYEEGSDPWAVYPGSDPPFQNKTEQVLPPASPATKANIDSAKQVVSKLNAYGGTDIKSALEVGLKLIKKNMEVEAAKNNTHQPMIIFLTDGEPTVGEVNTNSIISKVSESNSGDIRSPIFSLSFGDGADREFLQKISLKNLGFARHIYEAADASLQLEEFYKQISSPLLSNITFKYVSNVTHLTRVHFPIFFHGSELVVAGRTDEIDPGFAGPTRIIGCGIGGHPIELIPKIEQPVGALERLWAYLTVKQILEERDAAENKTEFTKKALDIALKYSFVTPVSSLVVVKPNDTRPVDTEDASKAGSDRPYYLNSMLLGSKSLPQSASMPLGRPMSFGGGSSGYRHSSYGAYPSRQSLFRSSTRHSPSSSSVSSSHRKYASSARSSSIIGTYLPLEKYAMCMSKTASGSSLYLFRDKTLSPFAAPAESRSSLRQALPQILAVCVKNVLLLGFGMTLGFPTILIPSLSGNNPNERFSLGQEAISWIGSINLICVPVGCLLSGAITQPIGRKRAMQFVNIPFLTAWLLFHFSTDVWQIFLALCITGVTGGLLEAPVLTYVAEITQPHLRGMLSSTSTMAVILGILSQFLIGTFLNWRTVAIINCTIPLLSFILLMFVPETPIWLISKNRYLDARKSIAWLRGWTSLGEIELEFQELCKQLGKAEDIGICEENSTKPKKNSKLENLKLFTKKNFVWPYALVAFTFFLGHFNGMTTLQTYAIKIFATLHTPIDKYYATIILGVVELLGCIVCVTLVHFVGKRSITFVSLLGCSICFLIVATYAHSIDVHYLEMHTHPNSTNTTTTPSNLNYYSWIPTTFLILSAFMSHIGIRVLPWILTGEVYSNETRAVASGLSGGAGYIFGFLSNKVFLTMTATLTLPGTFWFYAAVSFVGVVILYFALPETEGKTLYEITQHFAGNSKLDNNVYRRNGKQTKSEGEVNPGFKYEENHNSTVMDESRL